MNPRSDVSRRLETLERVVGVNPRYVSDTKRIARFRHAFPAALFPVDRGNP